MASNPELRRPHPRIIERRAARKAKRQALKKQAREDLSELDTDPFRQGSLNQYNSADAPYRPNFLEELEKKYPEWYQ